MFDVAIIGGGPGGYVCAIRAAQLGLKVALVEKASLGGTCLNVGCIPSKAMLDSSELYHAMHTKGASMGVLSASLSVDVPAMVKRKQQVVELTGKGVAQLLQKNKVEVHQGTASLLSASSIRVTVADGTETTLGARNIVIATGSIPSKLPDQPDHPRVIDSTGALALDHVPKSLAIVGGGVIGLELGSVWARLGAEVTVVEYLPKLLPSMDGELAGQLQKVLAKDLRIRFRTGTKLTRIEASDASVKLSLEEDGKPATLEAEYALIATGRRPFTTGLGLDTVGLALDPKGRIPVDAKLRTGIPGIWAIGDVIEGPMLAHKAEEEGVFVAETIAGAPAHLDHALIPGVVYTDPEFSGVGETEESCKAKGLPAKVGRFPFRASGRARAAASVEGMAKVISHAETDEVLGVHVLGPRAADLIGEAVIAMAYRATAEDIGRICHAHPTFSEALKEAALDATGKRAIHS